MDWLAKTKAIFQSVKSTIATPLTGRKRPRQSDARNEVEVEQPVPSRHRADPPAPALRLQFDALAGSASGLAAPRAKPGVRRDAAQEGSAANTPGAGAPPPLQLGQSPRYPWPAFPKPATARRRPPEEPHQAGPPLHLPAPLHPGALQRFGGHNFGVMGQGTSMPGRVGGASKTASRVEQPLGYNPRPRNGFGPRGAEAERPNEPARGAGAAGPRSHPLGMSEPSEPWQPQPFHSLSAGIFSSMLEPGDPSHHAYKRASQEADLAKQRYHELDSRGAAVARKAAEALNRGPAEQDSARLEAELEQLQSDMQQLRVKRQQAEQVASGAEVEGEEELVMLPTMDVDETPALPLEFQAKYEEVTGHAPTFDVIVKHRGIEVRFHDMAKLAPGEWLNDELINVFMNLLLERDARWRDQGASGPSCHFFGTFFASKLYQDTGYNYKEVKRWTLTKRLAKNGQRSASILDCDRIIIPINQSSTHWVCAVIDLKQHKFVYYDSLMGEDWQCLDALAKYVRDEYKDKKGEERDDVLEWPRECPKDIPRQRNGCDCGVFTMLFAEYASRGARMHFTQDDMQYFRVKLANDILALNVA